MLKKSQKANIKEILSAKFSVAQLTFYRNGMHREN